jgi:hypothetical protein
LEELGEQVGRFIETSWAAGESRNYVSDAICGIQQYLNRKRVATLYLPFMH